MLAVYKCLDKIRHRHNWWSERQDNAEVNKREFCSSFRRAPIETSYNNCYYDGVLTKHRLIICPNGNTMKFSKTDSPTWEGLLFTDSFATKGEFLVV